MMARRPELQPGPPPQMVEAAGSLSRSRERARVRARELRKSSPDAESRLWQHLRNRQHSGFKFRRQHPVGRHFADFACIEAGLIVELDGGQHFEPEAMQADGDRSKSLNALGFDVLRFTDREALTEMPAVLQAIYNWLNLHHPHRQSAPAPACADRSAGSPHAARKPPLTPSPLPHAGEGADPYTHEDRP